MAVFNDRLAGTDDGVIARVVQGSPKILDFSTCGHMAGACRFLQLGVPGFACGLNLC